MSVLSTSDAVREGLFTDDALTGGRCAACGTLRFPIREVCPSCQHDVVEPVALSTTGTIYTFTVVRAAPPGYQGETPYAYGVVELPEGLRVTTTITADDLDAIAIGDHVAFELIAVGDVTSYAYRLTEESA
jgi:uncharacterized OB-fold protein